MRRSLAGVAVLAVGVAGWTGARTPLPAGEATDGAGTAAASAALDGRAGNGARRTRFVPAAEGNEVRYRVREQLANIEFPSDAVGATNGVTGAIVVEDDGTVVRAESRFAVDLTGLTSDAQMRDRYIQRNTLETADSANTHAFFVPVSLAGLTMPLPATGELSFRVTGGFTVRGTTRATTWDVVARPTAQGVRGNAKTAFTFDDFGLTKPRVARVLSVVDTIRLEYDFNLVRDPAR